MVAFTRVAAMLALAIGASAAVTQEEIARVLAAKTGSVNLQLQVTKDAIMSAMARGEALVGTVTQAGESAQTFEDAAAEDKLLLTVTVNEAQVTRSNVVSRRKPVEWFDF